MTTLSTLFNHNRWANLRLIDVCAGLSDEQLDSTAIGTYGSIRATLEHIVTAERSYLARLTSGQPYRRGPDAPRLTLSEMRAWAEASGAGLIDCAPIIGADDTFQATWDGVTYTIPRAVLLTQAINHATEHRAQIMAILTGLGVEPPELDGWTYFLEPGDQKAS